MGRISNDNWAGSTSPHDVGMSMKRFRLRTGKGQRIVGSGESHQDFHRMSAGAHKGAPRLWQLPCLPFHLLHFRPARQGPTVNSTNPL